MGTFWSIVVVLGAAALIWFNVKMHDPEADKARRAEQRAESVRQQRALVCPHCGVAGGVTPRQVHRKRGISGGKATGALFTGGASMLVTGLSRKQRFTSMRCSNCGTSWDVA